MNKTKLVIPLLLVLGTIGCSAPVSLIDYYTLYPPYEISDNYCLICKLSSEGDPKIDSVKYLRWSKKMIIIQQTNSSWWVIKAYGDVLCCGHGDTTIGPLDDKAVQPYFSEMTDVIQEMYVSF